MPSAIVKDKQLLIENKELFERLYSAKKNLIKILKVSESEFKLSQINKLLYFYRFSYKEDLTKEEVQEVFEQRGSMVFQKTEEEINETKISIWFRTP